MGAEAGLDGNPRGEKRPGRLTIESKGGASMKPRRLLLALALAAGLVGVAYVAPKKTESAGMKMVAAAEKFVDSLNEGQKARAVFDFDSKERTNWHFVPMQDQMKNPTRKGLPLQKMTEDQKKLAMELVAAGTSDSGKKKAVTIMSLEAILRDLENGSMVRNPQWYFFAVFGKPSKDGKWGWRVEGHHLALNFVVDKGKVTASTPAFFGANPATVKAGKRKGLRTLPGAEDLAKQLFKSLDEDQKKVAHQSKQFPEIRQGDANPGVGEPKGLAAEKMTKEQRGVLLKLLQSYANRMPPDVAEAEMKEVKDGGIDKIHFAYAGDVEEGKPHTYRIQGPTFVVEFLNTQRDSAGNPANHIHSAWRHLKGDFGVSVK
jgi:hypothetical protein